MSTLQARDVEKKKRVASSSRLSRLNEWCLLPDQVAAKWASNPRHQELEDAEFYLQAWPIQQHSLE
jgi:hypothetical protein